MLNFNYKNLPNIRFKLDKLFSQISFSQESYLLVLGGITGVLAGIGAIIFHHTIEIIKHLFYDFPAKIIGKSTLISDFSLFSIILLIFLPAIGGLFVGLFAYFFEKGEKGEGIPNVIDAVATKAGVIKGTIAIKKIIGTAISIGSGGAGGKEGPIVQIGASIGSAFGQILKLSSDRLKVLLGCGAAAGLAAAFNAPLGGALFAIEIILRSFRAQTFSPIIIASVFATAISRSYIGNEPAFKIPPYELISNIELFFYIFLGILSGLVAVYFVKVFYLISDIFSKLKKINPIIKPALGGLIVGILAVYLPGLYGFTYVNFNVPYSTDILLTFFGILIFKPIATAATIGSGGNGGTFAPSLVTGAMLGSLFGFLVNYLFPNYAAPSGAYAMVGMAGVVAGTTNASLTALIMTFEMTNNYKIILPLMLTIIISTTVAKSILKGSLYSIKFAREGREIDIYGRKVSILKKIYMGDLISKEFETVNIFTPFEIVINKIKSIKLNSLIVCDNNDFVVGQIFFEDIREALLNEETAAISQFLVAEDFMTKNIKTVNKNSTADFSLNLLEASDIDYLPVVEIGNNKLIGIVNRIDILNHYQKELLLGQKDIEI